MLFTIPQFTEFNCFFLCMVLQHACLHTAILDKFQFQDFNASQNENHAKYLKSVTTTFSPTILLQENAEYT